MDKRIELLEERTVIFLEKTKKQREKYKTERKTLFDFSVSFHRSDLVFILPIVIGIIGFVSGLNYEIFGQIRPPFKQKSHPFGRLILFLS